MIKVFKKANAIYLRIFNKLKKDHISEYSAECAYYTILSFIPFIIFLLTIIQYINIDKETMFFYIKEIIPSGMQNIIFGIIEEIYTKTFGTISIAILFTLWSAGKGFFALCKGLRTIYNVDEQKRNIFIRIEGTIYTLVFIVAIILFLIIMVFGNSIHKFISNKFIAINVTINYIINFRTIFFLFFMFFIFLMIYSFVPKHKLRIKTQIIGAIFSSVSLHLISWMFSIYIDLSAGFSNTYGSLTSIIIIMMWVYACMYIILLGAEINYFINSYDIISKIIKKCKILKENRTKYLN